MKNYVLTIAVLLFVLMSGNSYSLSNFNYTGIAFDGTGEILALQSVDVNIKIILGTVRYEENHTGVMTDQFGAFTVEVGNGTGVSGDLSGITATKELRIQATITSGSGGTWVVRTLKPNVAVTGANSSPSSWTLTGNEGTTAGTNFIGTTDNVPFEMRVASSGTTENQFFIGANYEIYRENPNLGGATGNTRGLAAVDLQGYRAIAAQVASGEGSTVGGGTSNTASGDYSTVGGGYLNTASNSYNTVAGGEANTTNGERNTIGGGQENTTNNSYSTVGGGYKNTANNSYSTVAGGYQNTASGSGGTVGGGISNEASGNQSTVAGGDNNTASGDYSAVGGGINNTASGLESTVAGGTGNRASGSISTIGGGYYNTANGSQSTVAGGYENTASGTYYSTVGGGRDNTASGDYSTVAGGNYAKADKYGQNAYASGRFFAQGDAQTSVFVVRNTSSASGWTTLYLDGSSENISLASSATWTFRIIIVGKQTGGTTNGAGYEIKGVVTNNGGTATILGTPTFTTLYESISAYEARVTVSGANLVVQVDGAGQSLRWVARVETAEVTW